VYLFKIYVRHGCESGKTWLIQHTYR